MAKKKKENDDNILVKKVPLRSFIEALIEVYNGGVDYVDLEAMGKDREKRDVINIIAYPEYVDTGDFPDDDEEEGDDDVETRLNKFI